MSNTVRDIVRKIQYEKDWTIEDVANAIDYTRVHLTRAIKSNSPAIRKILEDRFAHLLDDEPGMMHNVTSGPATVPIERLLQEVERSRDDVKASRDLLARLLESNLTALATNQQVLLATLQSFVEHQAIVEAKGDRNKAELIAADIQKTIAEKLAANSIASSPIGRRK